MLFNFETRFSGWHGERCWAASVPGKTCCPSAERSHLRTDWLVTPLLSSFSSTTICKLSLKTRCKEESQHTLEEFHVFLGQEWSSQNGLMLQQKYYRNPSKKHPCIQVLGFWASKSLSTSLINQHFNGGWGGML